jgi:tetratricopeptide (TPR) repeat protein
MRRFEDSRAVLERCLELDPFVPLELPEMSLVMAALHRPEAAREYIRRAGEAAPDFVPMAWLGAVTLEQAGDIDHAIALLKQNVEMQRPERRTLGGLANHYFAKGDLAGTRRMLERLI